MGPGGEEFLHDGLAGAELGDDGDDSAFGGGGDAAVGCIVAEPDDFGDEGIEVGEMEGGDVAADAVDHEPGAGLPGPADGLGGEGIIDADGAADDEGPVGDVVDFAEGPLFLDAVDDEGADAKGGGVFGFCVGRGLWGSVGNFARGAEGDGVDLGAFGGSGDRAEEEEKKRDAGERDARGRDARGRDAGERDAGEQGHWSRAEGLHAWKASRGATALQ